MTTAILGGGLTGLTLGYLLNQKRIEIEILEKENECGGLMRTLREDGFTFDYGGSHIFFSKEFERKIQERRPKTAKQFTWENDKTVDKVENLFKIALGKSELYNMIGRGLRYIKQERKLPSLSEIKSAKRALIKREIMPLPTFIQLEPTTKCNYKCVMCSRSSLSSSRLNKDISLSEFKFIIHQIPSLKSVHLQGLGEPFLSDHLLEILEYAKEKKFKISTTTNASLLTSQEDIKKFFPLFSEIRISINSINPKTHRLITGVDNYEKIKRNIELIASLKDSYQTTKLWLSFVVTHLNYNELDSYFSLCRKMRINCGVVEVENWYIPSQEQYDSEVEFIKKSRIITQIIRKKVSNFQSECKRSKIELGFLSSEKRKLTCRWPFDSCFITVDGYVTPCCIRHDPEVFNFGNIFETPFKEIWNSELMQEFRRSIINNTLNPICDNCPD